ncbi:hypothetical protein IQ255_20295 [Pleurocapsales cyanobacterium LEGE 10410]|nr:hypothetical protein [Pleurocapsales cyanobacterium LEGE 10410]
MSVISGYHPRPERPYDWQPSDRFLFSQSSQKENKNSYLLPAPSLNSTEADN